MNALQIHTRKDLPSDPEKLREYSWNLTLAYQQLVEKYRKLLGNQFGKSSEKLRVQADLDALQMEMDELLSQIAALQDSESEEKEDIIEITAHNRRRKKYGRNSIPAELIEDVVVDFSEEEKKCSECGSELHQFATKAHIVVERIPAKYEVKRYIMPVYGCPCCKSGVTYKEMPLVSPIPKGVAGISLLLFVLVNKYQYHLPLYRIQRQIYHESRIWFTRSTLCSWIKQCCGLLERIYKGLLEQYLTSKVKHADETPVMVKAGGKLRDCWMWTGLGGDGRTAVFVYNRHRSGAAALSFLEGSSPGDYLMIDDCPSYNKPVKALKLIVLRCMAHIRRKFVEAHDNGSSHKDYLKKILIRISQLYRIERFADKKGFTEEQRTELRQKLSSVVLAKIKDHLLNPGFVVLPQSSVGKAINYFLNNWDEAVRFLENGALPIDNTPNEQIIRHLPLVAITGCRLDLKTVQGGWQYSIR